MITYVRAWLLAAVGSMFDLLYYVQGYLENL